MESFLRRQDSDPSFPMTDAVPGSANMLSISPVDNADSSAMMAGDTLDAIIMQNNKEMERRRSVQQRNHYSLEQSRSAMPQDIRRTSMLEFSSPTHAGNLDGFQFSQSYNAHRSNGMQRNPPAISTQMHENTAHEVVRRQSSGNTQMSPVFDRINSFPTMGQNFQQPIRQSDLPISHHDSFGQPTISNMGNSMNIDYGNDGIDVSMFPHQSFHQHLSTSHIPSTSPEYPKHLQQSQDRLIEANSRQKGQEQAENLGRRPQVQISDAIQSQKATGGSNGSMNDRSPYEKRPNLSHTASNDTTTIPQITAEINPSSSPSKLLAGSASVLPLAFSYLGRNGLSFYLTESPSPASQKSDSILIPKGKERPQNAYSSTGFDMLSVLMRVATRPHPEINIGAVDMSCAFVVCDVGSHDLPIVYCSDIFERMTGYSRHEILGQNCRFLQSPTGKVQSGVPRKYCDDDTVLFLKKRIEARKEAQAVIINYRKGGHAFSNLLTMIPVSWDKDDEIKYFVGFQTDLVERPNSILAKNADGTYSTNYQRGYVPRYVWSEPETRRQTLGESGHTIPRDDVSTVLTTIGSGESELSRRIWDKVLLENTDDVVHVLSLKGLFLYLSPSSRKVLEYDSSELVGTALSSVCHPSDIVPVTRELKDTSTGASVNVVFRMRRKHSGYCWFESHGSLHTEQGKGRKCIILVGRERPVYALSRHDITEAGGLTESELWSKMSTSGMFLFVSSNSKQLLDRHAEDMIGTSIQSLMKSDSKIEFGRILEQVRSGKSATFKHELQHKRGQFTHAMSVIYPGDAAEGLKPTFVVVQTQFLQRQSRSGSQAKSIAAASAKVEGETGAGAPLSNSSALKTAKGLIRKLSSPQSPSTAPAAGITTATEGSPTNVYDPITSQAGGSGLPLGSQDVALASELNVFDELKTTRSTSWQFELRQMERKNRILKEELESLLSSRRKRKRRKGGSSHLQKECVNCHTRSSPEWRRGPSGQRDLCNSCGLRWNKQGRTSPRSQQSGGNNSSPNHNGSPHGAVENQPQAPTSVQPADLEHNFSQSQPSGLDLFIPQTAHSFENMSATRPPKIEEQDEGTMSTGID
ncbi:MAG: blue light receptor [Vezdaea aestivalis]|nr:MAG: blue light receptor [Vezdaea aestivalis]